MAYKNSQLRSAGLELARVLPNDGIPWYQKRHLLRLNFALLSLFLLSASDGYDGSLMSGRQALPRWQEFMNNPTDAWLGLLSKPTTADQALTLGVFAQWNGVGIVSYYLAPILRSVGITSVTSQTMISGFLQLWNLTLAISAASNVDRFGRRPLFLVSSVGMLCTYIVISGLSGSFAQTGTPSIGTAVIPFLFIYYGFYDFAFTPLLVSYTCETWSYNPCASGLGLGMTVPGLRCSSTPS
ncbi:uncharacterized protein BDV17DRAFT_289289 [Aspergillus undulatus]|uniref:uncharacterized protein n=1 Tax=Aspergillus undulatus TaxID=1810928 RepID=UPI003CCD1805